MSSTMTNDAFGGKNIKIEQFDANERLSVQEKLEKKLGPEYISTRPGAGGVRVSYLEGWKAVNLANSIFGFNGWYSEVKNITVDYLDSNNGKYGVGISATIRVILKDGAYHEDIGYGSIENARSKAAAFEKAKKEAVTDGLKRALRSFGNAMGNCLYDKDYLKRIHGVKVAPPDFDESNLMRFGDPGPSTRANTMPPKHEETSFNHNQSIHQPQHYIPQTIQHSKLMTPAKHSASPIAQNLSSNLNNPNRYPPPQALRNNQAQQNQTAQSSKVVPVKPSLETPTNTKFYNDIDFDESLTFSDDIVPDSDNDDIDNFFEEKRLKELSDQNSALNNLSNITETGNDQTAPTTNTSVVKSSSEHENTKNQTTPSSLVKEPIVTNNTTNSNRIQIANQTEMSINNSQDPVNIPAQVGFFTARVAEKVQNNNVSSVDQFNPQFISPSMRRTVDPTKSAPIKRITPNSMPASSSNSNPLSSNRPVQVSSVHLGPTSIATSNSTPSSSSTSAGPGLAPNSAEKVGMRYDNPRMMPNRQIGKPRYPPPKRTKLASPPADVSSPNENGI